MRDTGHVSVSVRDRIGVVIVTAIFAAANLPAGCSGAKTPSGGNGNGNGSGFAVSVDDFTPATSCQGCHPQHYADWAGSMHAYSIVDPVWNAVRAVGQSAYANALAGACSPCHGTVGNRSGVISWGPLDFESLAPQVSEGVGCDLCHVITSVHGLSNASFNITPGDTKFGTIKDPVPTTAHKSQYSSLYKEPEYCGSCHDFILGNGTELEAVFREWQSGGFAMTGKTCNDCHMPTYEGPAATDGPVRTLHRHTIVGADLALIDFPNRSEQFDLVTKMLQSAVTLEADATAPAEPGGDATVEVRIINDKTGHNVPSGVPFNREMWLSVMVRDASGAEVFSSGQLDENDELMDAAADPQLFNAQSTMLKADSTPTGATWEAAYLKNTSIKVGETRVVSYEFGIPPGATSPLSVDVTLRFRSFSPVLIRSLGLFELLPIPIIDMADVSRSLSIPQLAGR